MSAGDLTLSRSGVCGAIGPNETLAAVLTFKGSARIALRFLRHLRAPINDIVRHAAQKVGFFVEDFKVGGRLGCEQLRLGARAFVA